MENIKTVIKDLLLKELEDEKDRIRESSDGEAFIIGYNSDYYNNGVGWALTSAPSPVYDEDGIKEEARQKITNYLKNGDENEFSIRLIESGKFVSCLIDLINEL